MRSLKAISLEKITKDAKNLPEVIKFLKKYPHVETDLDFWKNVLEKHVWEHWVKELLTLRGDLQEGSDWFTLCQDMVRGNAYIYSWYGDGREDFIEPMFSRSIDAPYDVDEVTIRGTLPRPGTHTVCAKLWRRHSSNEIDFCAFGQSPRDALERAVRWILICLVGTSEDGTYIFEDLDEILKIEAEDVEKHIPLIADAVEIEHEKDNSIIKFSYRYRRDWREGSQTQNSGFAISKPLLFPEYETE